MNRRNSPKLEKEIIDSFCIEPCNSVTGYKSAIRLVYHRIVFVIGGSGRFFIDGNVFEVAANQLFLIAKDQVFQDLGTEDLEGFQISFGDCFWDRAPQSANNCKAVVFNTASDHQCLPLGVTEVADLSGLMTALYSEFKSQPYINKLDALSAFLKIIMIKIANLHEALSGGFDTFEKQIYQRFLELVSLQYSSRHEVSYYAAELNVTPRRLSEICRRSCAKPAKDILSDQLVAEAKRRLQFSALAIKEIAIELNFRSAEHFTHFFKKHVQSSPSAFRANFVGLVAGNK